MGNAQFFKFLILIFLNFLNVRQREYLVNLTYFSDRFRLITERLHQGG